jgi:regulation of enolase protein 1 (concanavalin A-like superfamily)
MYVHRQITGDATIVARVLSIANAASSSARAGVMIRQALTTTSPFVFAAVSPSRGVQYFERNSDGSTSSLVGATAAPPAWLRLERRGSTVTASWSRDGNAWTVLSSATIATGSPVYVGMAVASQTSSTATATIDNVTVTAPGSNQPPTAALTAPANGATYNAPATIAMTATASDPDGSIARVDFYAGSTLLGSDTSSPYAFSWSGAPTGTHTLTAVARDNAGSSTTSAPVNVTVGSPPLPTRAVFNPSPDHATTAVSRYELEIFTSGANPATATPVQIQNLGKPTPANGECSVSIAATIQSLPGGTYIATVKAVGPGGTARSAPSAPFTR